MSDFQVFTEKEIASLREGGKILHECLKRVAGMVRPGVKTITLDQEAQRFICSHPGAIPGFKGYHGYPAALCTSVNDECVHGIPSERVLKEGDIISLDCGVLYHNLYTDACVTVAVGSVTPEARNLMEKTSQALASAISVVRAGAKVGDLSAIIEEIAKSGGFTPVRFLTGHGLGSNLHQFPDIPNSGKAGTGPILPLSTIIAVEPIICTGNGAIHEKDDGWTIMTDDGSICAHEEHTLLILPTGCEILT
ncbi:MAG: type I methionyl aminopeptidase [Candidatus Peribacteraceae bacterium]|nr:type I methionyl aminopeptidase [Candidatus Peribacteraceae bacterium]